MSLSTSCAISISTLKQYATEVEKLVGYGPEIQVYGDPALTGKVKKVFEYANEEAANLNHNYVARNICSWAFATNRWRGSSSSGKSQCQLKEVRKEVLKELETFNLQLPPMAEPVKGPHPAQPGGGQKPPFEKGNQRANDKDARPEGLWPRPHRNVP